MSNVYDRVPVNGLRTHFSLRITHYPLTSTAKIITFPELLTVSHVIRETF